MAISNGLLDPERRLPAKWRMSSRIPSIPHPLQTVLTNQRQYPLNTTNLTEESIGSDLSTTWLNYLAVMKLIRLTPDPCQNPSARKTDEIVWTRVERQVVLKRGMKFSRACLFVTSFSLGLDFFLFLAHLTQYRNVIMSYPSSVVVVFIIVVMCGLHSSITDLFDTDSYVS